MDYVRPAAVAQAMIDAAGIKLALAPRDLFVRGVLSGALLGISTSLALTAALATGQGFVGAIVFPFGIATIVLLGLELVTGSFGLVPLSWFEGRASLRAVGANIVWVFLGNLVGSVVYGLLLAVVLTNMFTTAPAGLAQRIVQIAEAKTTGYAALGGAGLVVVFVKAMLCNWMVCLSAVLAMTSTSAIGKIVACWLPIFVFFAQGFEHAVVNMFVIPTGMMMGARVTLADWWLWNQIPVTLGNIVGGFFFTGLAIYLTYRPKSAAIGDALAAPLAAE
ncbi:formate/nitrite transporter family protein [Reyranella sp.]|jgi:formate/nitrite transporter|uniref:formate/nitrite transporter family protein n=1 Tax=Reyranella sp. TaxID=1929291 RepID=UPI002F91D6DF